MEKAPEKQQGLHTFLSRVKSFLFADHAKEAETLQHLLSDKNTFFAWQRNHMANERTFLAWCRTGISLIVFSFVIERFDLLIRELRVMSPQPEKFVHLGSTRYMALIVFILGAFIMLLAGWRFFNMRRHINLGETELSTLPDTFLLVSISITLAMIFLLFVFVF
jgi:putative membrane protein